MTVYTVECYKSREISSKTYVFLYARNNSSGEREELVIRYFDYCFVDEKKAHEISKKHNLNYKDGYTFYEDDEKCSKVYFNSTSIMNNILTAEKIERASLTQLDPARKLLLDKGIRYKFIVNDEERPLDHQALFPLDTDEIDDVKTIYCDIEVDSEEDIIFPTGDNSIHPVISISYTCPNGDNYWTCLDKKIQGNKKELIWKTSNDIKELNDLKVNVILFKHETDMIKFVGEIQRKYDNYVITGWNFLRFDAYYLIGRCKVLGIPKEVISISDYIRHTKTHDDTGRDIIKIWTFKSYFIDALESFIKYYPEKLKYNDLESVAKEVLGVQFGKYKMNMSIAEAYRKNKKELMNYNITDSILVKLIDEKIRLFKFFELRRKKRGLVIKDVFATIKPIDASLLYFAEESKVALPNTKHLERSLSLKGADVYTEKATIFPYAFMMDFRSEYPSIAASLNCSRRTLVKEPDLQYKLEMAYKFYKKSKYINKPKILNDYTVSLGQGQLIFFENKKDCFEKKFLMKGMKERERYFNIKNKFEFDSLDYLIYHAYEQDEKLDGNSLYGSWANKYFRLGEIKCGQAITSVGRTSLSHQRQYIFSLGHRVAISDTDSSDFGIENEKLKKEEAVKIGYEVEEKLANEMDKFVHKIFLFGKHNGYRFGFDINNENINTQWIFAKFEKLFSPMITTGKKKHYAYKLIWKDGRFLKEPKYKVVGLPCIKKDASPIFRDAQFGLIKNILDKKMLFKPEAANFIRQFKKKMKECDIEYLSSTGAYKTAITQYKNIDKGYLPPIHAQAMCNSRVNFGIIFEPISRFKILKVKRIKSGKYDTDIIFINGIRVIFKETVVGYNDKNELPEDFFEYFQPDYDYIFNDLILKKNNVFLKILDVNPVIFSGQNLITDFIKVKKK